jgi:hypothetical protein
MQSCDVCDRETLALVVCDDRGVKVCPVLVTSPGRLGGMEHPMPGRQTICAHRRADSLAVKLGAGASVLYEC